ncbi:hypothetical protein [Nocardioides sp. Kera G14]|uniref:hypothetical protein n=1 Tax=Nocardioides sp. Kera G14 TaxID=2884264 RepID=UPI001D11AA9E|nr:hypothetical protein [Nocardioides sp. Kera G14]UDY23194.1 hypothetical protein LH076_14165 [Nocardioides sp. Kera G14]
MDWLINELTKWADQVHWVAFATIPLFTGVIGWLINWSGLWMLFNPTYFKGVAVPGMRELVGLLPRKVQEVPGLLQGGLGWQGIIPARAAKMGSIAVDKAIAKLGTPSDFYQQLEPDKIAEHIISTFGPEVPELVDQVMRQEHPRLWRDLPPAVRAGIVARVQAQLPGIVSHVTDEIGEHIDQLLDPKYMVIEHFRTHPALVVRIFRDFGQRELNLMVAFGFIFGFLLGIPVAIVDSVFHHWWVLPVLGVVVGWVTNALGMWLIFEPPAPRRVLGVKVQGLFPRRQSEAAEVYARIIADDVITLERIGDHLLNGPRGDATHKLLGDALRPAIDQAAGPIRGAVRVAVGTERFDSIRESVTKQAVGRTLEPFQDLAFSRKQAERIQALVAVRTRELHPAEFVDMMRSAIKEDEWMLYAHGAIMGLAGGFLHYVIFSFFE